MLINNKLNFAFIHIQKTAGMSISSTLINLPETEEIKEKHAFITRIPQQDRYFKFTFVRNPWDRLYSWYNMMINKGIHNSFSDYLLNNSSNFSEFLDCTKIISEEVDYGPLEIPYYKSISFNQLDYISNEHGKICADFIGRFENLQNDFDKVLNILGVERINLPHENKFEHDNYKKYYTKEDAEKVFKLYQRDIEYFNYSF